LFVFSLEIDIKFKPNEVKDGVLLYSAQNNEGTGDFLALVVKDEKVELRFDTGSGLATLRSNRNLKPGKWHWVKASRGPQTLGSLSVDKEELIVARSPGSKRGLNLGTLLYLGGWDSSTVTLNPKVGIDRGFEGCVSKVSVEQFGLYLRLL